MVITEKKKEKIDQSRLDLLYPRMALHHSLLRHFVFYIGFANGGGDGKDIIIRVCFHHFYV